jgi:uncharacterized membrane protein YkvA (DUF1232 family)
MEARTPAPLATVDPSGDPPPQALPALGPIEHLRAFAYALRDPTVPWAPRLGFLLGVLYVLSPWDLIPDVLFVLFGLGVVDDVAVLLFLSRIVMRLPEERHRRRAIGDRAPEPGGSGGLTP